MLTKVDKRVLHPSETRRLLFRKVQPQTRASTEIYFEFYDSSPRFVSRPEFFARIPTGLES